MFDREDWGIMRLSASAKGTYVFDDYKNNDVIRISRVKDCKREEPKLLGKKINTGKWTAHPFIAPDESYLMSGGILREKVDMVALIFILVSDRKMVLGEQQ